MHELWKSQALDPKWDEAGRIHDWRNYVYDEVRAIWHTFTDEQKMLLAGQADEMATREEWD